MSQMYLSSLQRYFWMYALLMNTTYQYLPSGDTRTWCGASDEELIPTSTQRMGRPVAASSTVTTSQPWLAAYNFLRLGSSAHFIFPFTSAAPLSIHLLM